MENKTFIVQGNIASGNTTLCKLLELSDTTRTEVIYEPVDKWISLTDNDGNNILKLFYEDIIQSNGEPAGYIYIRCEPEISYERLKFRSRSEEETVPLDYLQLLHKYHDEWLLNDKNVLVIDVNKDFEHDKEELERIMTKINDFVGCKKEESLGSTCALF